MHSTEILALNMKAVHEDRVAEFGKLAFDAIAAKIGDNKAQVMVALVLAPTTPGSAMRQGQDAIWAALQHRLGAVAAAIDKLLGEAAATPITPEAVEAAKEPPAASVPSVMADQMFRPSPPYRAVAHAQKLTDEDPFAEVEATSQGVVEREADEIGGAYVAPATAKAA